MKIILEQKNPVDSEMNVGLEEILNLQNRKLAVTFSPSEIKKLFEMAEGHLANSQGRIVVNSSLTSYLGGEDEPVTEVTVSFSM